MSAAEKWSAVAAIASAGAAFFALVITLQERDTPYKTALYTARWQAIENYAQASADLSTALHLAAVAVPPRASEPNTLMKMSDAELRQAARAARPAIEAWGDFIARSSGAGAPWSMKVQDAIAKAEASGKNVYECYRRLGAYVDGEPTPPGWWDHVRKIAPEPCTHFRDKERDAAFDRNAELVLRAMTDELRLDDDQFVPGASYNQID